jgi:hypothetical protein
MSISTMSSLGIGCVVGLLFGSWTCAWVMGDNALRRLEMGDFSDSASKDEHRP